MRRTLTIAGLALALVGGVAFLLQRPEPGPAWTSKQVASLRSLLLDSLEPLPPDPTNAVADDPRAAGLGHQLFFDKRFSANGEVSCSSCHLPAIWNFMPWIT